MKYDFRIDILRDYIKIGEAKTDSCRIRYDSTAECFRGLQTDIKKIELSAGVSSFEMFSDRLRPVLISNGTEYPLGIYMIIAAPRSVAETHDYYSIEAYDETMILKQAKLEERLFLEAGTNYLDAIQEMLGELGFANIKADAYDAEVQTDVEFEIGASYLEIINTLLDAINYKHIHTDLSGYIMLLKESQPDSPSFTYSDLRDYRLIAPLEVGTDIYDLPNVVVGIYSSPDLDAPMIFTKSNDDPQSVISTVRRGYKVVHIEEVRNASSYEDMQNYIEKIAFEAMQSAETVKFKSAVEGGHEAWCAVQLDTEKIKGLYIEKNWQIEISPNRFEMDHTVERKVFV